MMRKQRNSARIFGTSSRPRLAVYRSNRSISAQLIDDEKGRTIIYASTKELGNIQKTKTELAGLVGELLAK